MNQKFIIIDDFYNAACMTGKDIHLNFLESEFKNEVVGEITEKVSSILNHPVQVEHVINEITSENSPNNITSNTVSYTHLTLPTS